MYSGKQLDGFDCAMSSYFALVGVNIDLSFDILSQRGISFKHQDVNGKFFMYALEWQEYMSNLIENTGITNYMLKSFSISNLYELMCDKYFILGEVRIPDYDYGILNKFIDTNSFLICRKRADYFEVSNPLGSIYERMSFESLISLTSSNSFIFYFEPSGNEEVIDKFKILNDSISIYEKNNDIYFGENIILLNSNRIRIAFHYGILNYFIMRQKYIEYFTLSNCVLDEIADLNINTLHKNEMNVEKVNKIERLFYQSLLNARN